MSSTATALSGTSNQLSATELRMYWRDVKRGSAEARERLILHYAPIVSFAERRLAGAFSPALDRQDLVASGVIGLIEAIERFDPNRGILFETFALHRIRGAMLDELRKFDWLPTSMRAKSRELDQAMARLSPALHRMPDDHELATEIGCNVRDIRERVDAATKVRMLALENLSPPTSEAAVPVSSLDATPGVEGEQPGVGIEQQEVRAALVEAVDELDDRDRQVIVLSYVEGLTLAQIGGLIGVSESRVSQIRSRIHEKLRERLADYVD